MGEQVLRGADTAPPQVFRSVVVTSRITARGLDSKAFAYYVRAVAAGSYTITQTSEDKPGVAHTQSLVHHNGWQRRPQPPFGARSGALSSEGMHARATGLSTTKLYIIWQSRLLLLSKQARNY